MRRNLTLTEKDKARLLTKFSQSPTGCWQWTDSLAPFGYGHFHLRNTPVLAHRVVYALFKGEPGDTLDHLCRNRGCVNPDHLESVTLRTNVLRGQSIAAANALKTHCPAGHPFDAITKKNQRRCKACNRAREERKRRTAGKPILKRIDVAMRKAICIEYAHGGITTRQLGEKYGIDYGYIARIIRNERFLTTGKL